MRRNRNTPGRRIAEAIIAEYKPQSVAEMQDALKDVFGPMFEAMLNGEMTGYLGYESNEKREKMTENRRNGYNNQNLNGRTRNSSTARSCIFI